MPLYEYWCTECGHDEQRFRHVYERDDALYCAYCRALSVRVLTAPHLHGSPNMPNG